MCIFKGTKNTGLSKEVIEQIKKIANHNSKYEFYIFGSRAKGTYKSTSDIDIAIFEDVKEEDKFKIMNEFDLLDIVYKIDLVFVTKDTKEELVKSIKKYKIKL